MVSLMKTSTTPHAPALQRGLALLQELFRSEAIFGSFAKHWHLGLGLTIIASVALLPNGLVGVPGQLRDRLLGRASRRAEVRGANDDRV